MKLLAALLLFTLSACVTTPENDPVVLTANTVCPISGNAVDQDSVLHVAGRPVYFCCEKCVTKGAEAPEKMLAAAYPN